MIFRFNKAQLGAKMEKALDTFIDAVSGHEKQDIEVSAINFPYELLLKRTSDGKEIKISYDPEVELYVFVEGPLPESIPTGKNVGDIKAWQRPESSKAPDSDHGTEVVDLPGNAPEPAQEEPAPPAQAPELENEVTVNNVVAQFMGLPVEQRPAFFAEVWKLINAEV